MLFFELFPALITIVASAIAVALFIVGRRVAARLSDRWSVPISLAQRKTKGAGSCVPACAADRRVGR